MDGCCLRLRVCFGSSLLMYLGGMGWRILDLGLYVDWYQRVQYPPSSRVLNTNVKASNEPSRSHLRMYEETRYQACVLKSNEVDEIQS